MKGDVVVIPFPFSDLSSSKKRPALVLATLKGNDIVLCQITSEARFDEYSIELKENDFKKGKLNINSMIRPNKLFTADSSLIQYKVGLLKESKLNNIIEKLIKIFKD